MIGFVFVAAIGSAEETMIALFEVGLIESVTVALGLNGFVGVCGSADVTTRRKKEIVGALEQNADGRTECALLKSSTTKNPNSMLRAQVRQRSISCLIRQSLNFRRLIPSLLCTKMKELNSLNKKSFHFPKCYRNLTKLSLINQTSDIGAPIK